MRAILFAALIVLSACDETYDDKTAAFVEYVKKHRLGPNTSYWLEKLTITGQWAKVVLVFGFPGNGEACRQLIEQDKKAGTVGEFRCTPAN